MCEPLTDDAFHGGEPIPAAWPRDVRQIHRFEPAGGHLSLIPVRVRVAGATTSPPPALRRPAREIDENEH